MDLIDDSGNTNALLRTAGVDQALAVFLLAGM